MAYAQKPQVFTSAINELTVGVGEKAITIGGQNTYNLYSFDAEAKNAPKVGIEVNDLGVAECTAELQAFYADCADTVERAKKAAALEAADFVALRFDSADPNGENKSAEDCAAVAKAVADAIDKPLVIMGSKNSEKDTELFNKISEALQGKNILLLAAKEENYKAVGASAGLAYGQKVGAESAVDINLAKQLNVLMTQLGVNAQSVAMNIGSAAAGYGFEYVVSTLDRVKGAALTQGDNMLQMPIITPVSTETWDVKESMASEADMPEWGSRDERAINMEVQTATVCLASGSDAVILRHPEAVKTVSALVAALM